MPSFASEDIFSAIANQRRVLAVLFGHTGSIGRLWLEFAATHAPNFAGLDIFSECPREAKSVAENLWLWPVPCIPTADNYSGGLTNEEIVDALDEAINWANQNSVKTIITNGIGDATHGTNTIFNRYNEDARAHLIFKYAAYKESESGARIHLVSLNDIYTRNFVVCARP